MFGSYKLNASPEHVFQATLKACINIRYAVTDANPEAGVIRVQARQRERNWDGDSVSPLSRRARARRRSESAAPSTSPCGRRRAWQRAR